MFRPEITITPQRSGLPEAQHEPVAGAAASSGGARRIVPVPCVVAVAEEIGFAIQYEPRCQHFRLDDILLDAMKGIGHFDDVPRARAVIDNQKYAARLGWGEGRALPIAPLRYRRPDPAPLSLEPRRVT